MFVLSLIFFKFYFATQNIIRYVLGTLELETSSCYRNKKSNFCDNVTALKDNYKRLKLPLERILEYTQSRVFLQLLSQD